MLCIRRDDKEYPEMIDITCYPERSQGWRIIFLGSPDEVDSFRKLLTAIRKK